MVHVGVWGQRRRQRPERQNGLLPVHLSLAPAHARAVLRAPFAPAPPPAKLAAGLTVFQTMTATGTGEGAERSTGALR